MQITPNISFASDDLIYECEYDISDFGAETEVYVWKRYYSEYDMSFITNYDFIDPSDPVTEDEIDENETVSIATLGDILVQLKKQNEIIHD